MECSTSRTLVCWPQQMTSCCARKNGVTPRTGSAVAGYCPLWAWLHSHQPARFCFWELTKQLPRVVTHPGIAPASNSLNFGVPTNPKPVSSQKASPRSEWRSGLPKLYQA
ncbi:hypothetical protein L3X38_000304 [Prunus dulcis]|uniref:Uncharacterized protein n=1 Tax=Prunus dulcis TaxID=3755 RepID=A0AAD4USD9_PRUDU|nr:hypothetical protein L3X38_000304 [Prunus dulcis]